MSDLIIKKKNETYIVIDCEKSIAQELVDYFTFMVPNAKHMPAYKNKVWDGKIRLFHYRNHTLYLGLLPYVYKFAKDRDYDVECGDLELTNEFSNKEATDFAKTLNLPFTPHDHQMKGFVTAIRDKRRLLVSPTASGKSLIAYMIARYRNNKTLIIVPTTGLVGQLYGDFKDYSKNDDSFDVDEMVHTITSGSDKQTNKPVVVSTWQSLFKMPHKYFEQYKTVIGDEAHQFKANSLKNIMEKCTNADQRNGLTGTLDGTQTHKLVLEGLFGPVKNVVDTKDLMNKNLIAGLDIKAIVFKYNDDVSKQVIKMNYQEEVNFLINHEKRNNFIKNLALSLDGNSLVLFRIIEHGEYLYKIISEEANDERKVFLIHGQTNKDAREEVRRIVETEPNAIIVASMGTFSTGINIRNLHNIIPVHPSKSRINILQSIGRTLRKGENKEKATLYDLADDFSRGKSRVNTTLNHFKERLKIYSQESFNYKIYKVKLNE